MTGDALPLRGMAADEPGEVPRWERFEREHPTVTIGTGAGYWQAQDPRSGDEQVITRHTLRELLDELGAT